MHCQPKKKKERKTSRGKVLNLKILNLNWNAIMKYCWSLLITDLEDLADLKFYLQSLSISLNRLRTDKDLVRILLYQTVLKFFKKDFILHSHD